MSILNEMKKKAVKDSDLKNRLISTKESVDPLALFCEIIRSYGYEIYPMDVVDAGEEMYAAMKRSTNGGGENSPLLSDQDDFYEMFIDELKNLGA